MRTAVSVVNRPEKASQNRTIVKIGIELQSVDSPTWEDFAIMAMVECGLGVSLLPELILRRVPYRIAIRKLDTPLYRDLALALPGQAHISAATRQFLRYLDRRDAPAVPAGSTGFDNRP